MSVTALIQELPKTELHLHIEGTLEPEMMMALAQKHQVNLPYKSIEEVEQAYDFSNLQSFLDLYYLGASVLKDEEDFYQLMWRYLCRCRQDNVVHCEIMFDPQTHTNRGIGFDVFMPGFLRAMEQAQQQWGQSSQLIMCFLRHLSEQSALDTLAASQAYRQHITAIGLDSGELGNPPEKFSQVFAKAREQGFRLVAHAGEEGPPDYIVQALDLLKVDRIDHGVRAIEDKALMQRLMAQQVPLTVCPQSNIKLCVFDHMADHNILSLLDSGLCVTVNADDPSYFGGYLNENYQLLAQHLDMQKEQLIQLVKNSFVASFLPETDKAYWLGRIDGMVSVL